MKNIDLEYLYKNSINNANKIQKYTFLKSLNNRCLYSDGINFLRTHTDVIDMCFDLLPEKNEGRGYSKRIYSSTAGNILLFYLTKHQDISENIYKNLKNVAHSGNKISKKTAVKTLSKFYLHKDKTEELYNLYMNSKVDLKQSILEAMLKFLSQYNFGKYGKNKKTYHLSKLKSTLKEALFSQDKSLVTAALSVINISLSNCNSDPTIIITDVYKSWSINKKEDPAIINLYLDFFYEVISSLYFYKLRISEHPEIELFISNIFHLNLHASKENGKKAISIFQLCLGLEQHFNLNESKLSLKEFKKKHLFKRERNFWPLTDDELELIHQNVLKADEICTHYLKEFDHLITPKVLTKVYAKWLAEDASISAYNEKQIIEYLGSAFGNFINLKHGTYWLWSLDKWGQVLKIYNESESLFPMDIIQKRTSVKEIIDFERILENYRSIIDK